MKTKLKSVKMKSISKYRTQYSVLVGSGWIKRGLLFAQQQGTWEGRGSQTAV